MRTPPIEQLAALDVQIESLVPSSLLLVRCHSDHVRLRVTINGVVHAIDWSSIDRTTEALKFAASRIALAVVEIDKARHQETLVTKTALEQILEDE